MRATAELAAPSCRCEGTFPAGTHEIPAAVVAHLAHLARQANVPAVACLEYDWHGRSITHHRAQLCPFLGVREAMVVDAAAVADWLVVHVLDRRQ